MILILVLGTAGCAARILARGTLALGYRTGTSEGCLASCRDYDKGEQRRTDFPYPPSECKEKHHVDHSDEEIQIRANWIGAYLLSWTWRKSSSYLATETGADRRASQRSSVKRSFIILAQHSVTRLSAKTEHHAVLIEPLPEGAERGSLCAPATIFLWSWGGT